MADTEKPAVDKESVRNAMEEIEKEKQAANEMSDLRNQLKNAMDEIAGLKNALNPAKPAEPANAEGEPDGDEKKEAAHGLPAQEIIKAFAKHYGRDFGRTTPSFAVLADIADIKGETLAEKARAVVAHAKALEGEEKTEKEMAHGAGSEAISFSGFSNVI